MVPEPHGVRFVGLAARSLDVEIFSHILASDMDSFVAMPEDLLLRIMATAEAAGTQGAFPSVVRHTADDNGLATDRIAHHPRDRNAQGPTLPRIAAASRRRGHVKIS